MFYDGECPVCLGLARRWQGRLARHGFGLDTLQGPRARRAFPLPEQELLREMRLLTASGAALGGADALLAIAAAIPILAPFSRVAGLPPLRPLLRAGYAFFARHRTCRTGSCRRPSRPEPAHWVNWLPSALTACGALTLLWMNLLLNREPAWGFMWVLAFTLFFACKWLTWHHWRRSRPPASRPPHGRALGYLLGWPGMDAAAFMSGARCPRPAASAWAAAVTKTGLGWLILRQAAHLPDTADPWLGAWVGMVGLVFLLHFGLLHLLALAWQRAGVNAVPLMNAPALSRSVREFWGRRWNTGFHLLARDFVCLPLSRRLPRPLAVLLTFLASGLVHDLVISVPARGGYGLPTLYFLIQAGAVLLEQALLRRRWIRPQLLQSTPGWIWTLLITAGPVGWLFPPRFVLEVMAPFIKVLGSNLP